jgi:hypothetical protein
MLVGMAVADAQRLPDAAPGVDSLAGPERIVQNTLASRTLPALPGEVIVQQAGAWAAGSSNQQPHLTDCPALLL